MTNYHETHAVSCEEAIAVLKALGFDHVPEKAWRYKYQNLRSSAVKRSANMNLTFKQYMKLARRAKLSDPSQIGRSSLESYQMGRIGDTGDYEWGNCRFITMFQNKEEKLKNGGQERASEKMRGRNKLNDAGYARVSKLKMGRTKENDLGRLLTSLKLSGRVRPATDFENSVKEFIAVSPKGKKFRSKNLSSFCRKHELDQGCMSRTVRGIQSTHKGWTGRYVGETK